MVKRKTQKYKPLKIPSLIKKGFKYKYRKIKGGYIVSGKGKYNLGLIVLKAKSVKGLKRSVIIHTRYVQYTEDKIRRRK